MGRHIVTLSDPRAAANERTNEQSGKLYNTHMFVQEEYTIYKRASRLGLAHEPN
jgi:hypothetical protein